MGQEILARYYKVGNHLSITIVALHSLLVYCTCQSISNFSHNVHAVCGSQYIVLRIYAGTINLVDIFLGWGTTHSTCILPYERSKWTYPPSGYMSWPVVWEERSDARKTTASAISSAVVMRFPSGIFARMDSIVA